MLNWIICEWGNFDLISILNTQCHVKFLKSINKEDTRIARNFCVCCCYFFFFFFFFFFLLCIASNSCYIVIVVLILVAKVYFLGFGSSSYINAYNRSNKSKTNTLNLLADNNRIKVISHKFILNIHD